MNIVFVCLDNIRNNGLTTNDLQLEIILILYGILSPFYYI